ncbi:Polyamine oxidase 1 [Linum perenne]
MASNKPPTPAVDVLIIGAGLSGLTAGKTLHEAGIRNIAILEADSRIGGRIRTAELGGYTVEMGANWLIGGGPKSSRLFEIANHLRLNNRFSDFNYISSNAYKQDGGMYSKQEVEEAFEAAEARVEFCNQLSSSDGDDISISAAQRLGKQEPKTPLEMVIDYFQNDYEEGEQPSVTSLKNTFPRQEYTDFGHKTYFVADPRGFQSIVHYIAHQFLSHHHGHQLIIDDPRLKLNQVVTEINYCKNGVRVKTEDGCEYHAKYAIVSVSLGVLQSNFIQFIPDLPEWKEQAVKEFDMGTFTKIFLRFPHKFWPSQPGTEFFLYAHERRGYYPIWHHLEHVMPGSNILFVAVTGDESKRILKLSDSEIQEEAMSVIRKMFGNKIPDPDQILVPRWLSNRFFRGSYSNWPAGYKTSSHKKLRDPIGPIFFTGEHTCAKYLGYADGAYSAGVDTANELVKILT